MFPLTTAENPLRPDIGLYPTVDAWLTALSGWITRTHGHTIDGVTNLHRGSSDGQISISQLEDMTLWVVMERGSNEGHYVSVVALDHGPRGRNGSVIRTLLSIKLFSGRRHAAIVQHDISLLIGQ